LIRGRGVLSRCLIQAQAAIPNYSPVYAALVAIVNSKIPEFGELLCKRLVKKFRDAYTTNNHASCVAALRFIAHLVNQRVMSELIAFEMLGLFLENPSEDSVELAVELMKDVGPGLKANAKKLYDHVIRQLRDILQEGVGARVDAAIKGLLDLSRADFKGQPAVPESLDLVEDEDKITHTISLSQKIDPETRLDIFQKDPQWQLHEDEYADIRRVILGEDEIADEEDNAVADEDDPAAKRIEGFGGSVTITDESTRLLELRRKIYLTIVSSVDYQEVVHKLLALKLHKPDEIREITNMVVESCANERSMIKMYAAAGQQLCQVNREYKRAYEELFKKYYETIHLYGTIQLNNIAKFFAHLLYTDSIHWSVLACIKLTEEDTTPAGRIFIKVLFREMCEYMGIVALQKRLELPLMQEYIRGIFPLDSTKNMRFSINFFTASGLGGLTQRLRDELKLMQQKLAQQAAGASAQGGMLDAARVAAMLAAELSDSSESSSSSSSSDISSDTSSDISSTDESSSSDSSSTTSDSSFVSSSDSDSESDSSSDSSSDSEAYYRNRRSSRSSHGRSSSSRYKYESRSRRHRSRSLSSSRSRSRSRDSRRRPSERYSASSRSDRDHRQELGIKRERSSAAEDASGSSSRIKLETESSRAEEKEPTLRPSDASDEAIPALIPATSDLPVGETTQPEPTVKAEPTQDEDRRERGSSKDRGSDQDRRIDSGKDSDRDRRDDRDKRDGRYRDRDRDRVRDRERDRNRDRNRDHDRRDDSGRRDERDHPRDRDSYRQRERSRSRDRARKDETRRRDRDRKRSHSQDADRDGKRVTERRPESDRERGRERDTGRRDRDRGRDHDRGRERDYDPDRHRDRGHRFDERPRERDSNSDEKRTERSYSKRRSMSGSRSRSRTRSRS